MSHQDPAHLEKNYKSNFLQNTEPSFSTDSINLPFSRSSTPLNYTMSNPAQNPTTENHEEDDVHLIDESEAAEVIEQEENDMEVDEDDEDTGVVLHNDSSIYFDSHTDSIFTISAHPTNPDVLLTGGGDDTAYLWTIGPQPNTDNTTTPRAAHLLAQLTPSHADSIIATAFTQNHAITAGLDGKIQVFSLEAPYKLVASASEVEEYVWLAAHPTEELFAAGASDGSVWVYETPLTPRQVFYNHTASCTAGVWSRDGSKLVTVSEDGSLYCWDVEAGHATVTLTSDDARFRIDGGLYSVAVSPSGGVAAVGGATGEVRVAGLVGEQKGKVLAAVNAHSESVESISFHPTVPLMASGSVDGKIVLYDVVRGFAIRATMEAHDEAVVKVEFSGDSWVLTSCGVDGLLKRWDARSARELRAFRGHLGGNKEEGEGGILGFVQNKERIITAGDDGVALVFDLTLPGNETGFNVPTVGNPRQ